MRPWIDKSCKNNPEEKEVVDERCYCGHLKSEHRATVFDVEGHGSCKECSCDRFTWFGWVFADGSEA